MPTTSSSQPSSFSSGETSLDYGPEGLTTPGHIGYVWKPEIHYRESLWAQVFLLENGGNDTCPYRVKRSRGTHFVNFNVLCKYNNTVPAFRHFLR